MRVVVVGAGVVGLLTAIECVHGGSRVTALEQGDIPYAWAASHDRHRVIRALHRGDAALTRAATVAYRHWAELERRLGGGPFHHPVGALTVLPPQDLAANLALLGASGAPARPVSPEQLGARYPRIRFPAGLAGVIETEAGVVLADR